MKDTPLAPTRAIPAAKQATAASDAANGKLRKGGAADSPPAGAAAPPAASSATSATAKSVSPPAVKDGSAPAARSGETRRERVVLRELSRGKAVVMLFWNADGADDRATRRALDGVNRRGRKVKVHVIPITRVADYSMVTRGVTIAQSPTTLIVGRARRTPTIVGLSERQELGQAVADALAKR